MTVEYVFVYGTLRKNECNHGVIKDSTCILRKCWTSGRLYDSHEGYPFLVPQAKGRVYGELYEVDAKTLQLLDELEDYCGPGQDNDYDRVVQTIQTENTSYSAYVYVLPDGRTIKNMTMIDEGDWIDYQRDGYQSRFE